MDPDANLKETRELVNTLILCDTACYAPDPLDVDRLVALVDALDEWYSMGGALAEAHQRNRTFHEYPAKAGGLKSSTPPS